MRAVIAMLMLTGLLAAGAAQAQSRTSAPPPTPVQPTVPVAEELDAARKICVATARSAQLHEQQVAALQRDIDLRKKSAAGAERGLQETRPEQERFLGTLVRIARNSPGPQTFAADTPIDRTRADMLVQATLPALRVEGHALASEVQRLAALRRDITAESGELTTAQTALDQDRALLASLIARRRDLARKALPEDLGADARVAKLGHDAKDVEDLIKRADAASDARDKAILAKARTGLARTAAATLTIDSADPTRPRDAPPFDPPQTPVLAPVGGAVVRVFESADATGEKRNAIGLVAPAGGTVVAPFTGRVVYAGPFRDLGVILIIRHGGLYHSVLAGLGRSDLRVDDWVLAGEPVGTMPEASDKAPDKVTADVFNLEVRREGRPVDPQPWLASNVAETAKVPASGGNSGDKADETGDRKGQR
jgi:septal ring factor EnvC (AmiA/AmiB activator)